MSGTYFVVLAALVLAAFFLGAQRARGMRGDTSNLLHSVPAYHGLYIAAAVLTAMMAIYVIGAPFGSHYIVSQGLGAFDPADPLRFEAFEVRFLGRREVPIRAVIDLSREDTVILRPQSYFKIPNPEDRLFIPGEFVPLFAAKGWRLEGFV